MRRKEKHIVNGALIGFGLVSLVDILIQWLDHKSRGVNFTWDSYNGKQTLKRGLLGAAVGGGIGYFVYEHKISEQSKLPFNSDEHLKRVLSYESCKNDPALFQAALDYREGVKQWLVDKFGGDLVANPENAGSFHKRTAIGSNYDLDIILPFKRDSYATLEEMYNDVYTSIGEKYGNEATISKQSKAIGVTFEENGQMVHFDIVPGREIADYKIEKDLNLYVRPDSIWKKGSSFKTNVSAQKNITVNKPEARRVIKLLKAYRDKNGFPLPSVIIEQGAIQALSESNYGIDYSDTKNMLNSMKYIAEKLHNERFIDVANSNNNLIDKVSEQYRAHIANSMLKDVERIEKNPRYISEIYDFN